MLRLPPARLGLAVVALSFACGSDPATGSSMPDGTNTGGTNTGGTNTGGTSTGGTNSGSKTLVSVPLALQPVPWDSAGNTFDQAMSVEVGDPTPAIQGTGSITFTNTTSVDTTSCTTTAGKRTCRVTLANVETKGFTAGMVVRVSDTRGSFGGTSWQALSTYVPPATISALQAGTQTDDVPAMMSTNTGTDQLATWSGVAKVDLISNGAVIGRITDKSGSPVMGAAVTVKDTGGDNKVVYAKPDFSGGQAQPATSGTATPWFLSMPVVAADGDSRVVPTSAWSIAEPMSKVTWKAPPAASLPAVLMVVPFPGQ